MIQRFVPVLPVDVIIQFIYSIYLNVQAVLSYKTNWFIKCNVSDVIKDKLQIITTITTSND